MGIPGSWAAAIITKILAFLNFICQGHFVLVLVVLVVLHCLTIPFQYE